MRAGFSLIEVIVGMLIFATGVLALSASTGFVSLQLQSADLRTERSVAYQQATEQLYAMNFDSVASVSAGNATTVGSYSLWWDVQSVRWALKEVQLYSEGPGFVKGRREASMTDTLIVRIARPVK
ncbi:MAG: prepilin-type N-terminal cleavage/methylation domain-containing protein [Gemmatimonadetes bacterium]|nr:prepilin-type N-terminal cleavage/methylation domain-containing protein [Gemmatimonadota bacterium]